MSDSPQLPEPVRTVSDRVDFHPDREMDVVGWLILLPLLVLFLPLALLFAVYWIVSRVVDRRR